MQEFLYNCHTQKKKLFVKNGYHIFECSKCSHRFAEINDVENHLSEVYSDSYFFGGKAGYPNYFEEGDLLIASGQRYSKILSRYTKPGKLLDVGCAAGFIMKGFENFGWKCEGIEPNNTMAMYGRNMMKLNIETISLEEFDKNTKYDLICLIEVIGHFYNLSKAINNISTLLTDDGFVLVESWNMKSAIAKLLGKRWHEYSPPSVLNWFSDKSLSTLFELVGLKLIASGHPLKRINIKHALSLLDEHMPQFYLKKQLFSWTTEKAGSYTVIYPLHDLKWYLFKKQASV